MKLIITGQQADWASKDLTVSGSDGIYLMEFELNDMEGLPSWESLTAYAVFKSSAMLAAYPDGIAVPINGGRAEIPAAILSEPGMLYVGVYGTNGSIVMPTIWAPAFCIALGCTEGSAPGPSVLDAARQAIKYGENAEVYAEGGYLVTDVQGPIEDPVLVRSDEHTDGAKDYADAAALSSNFASARAKDAEAYAIGSRDGEPVASDDPAYENNAKYYAGQAANSASDAHADAVAAHDDAVNAHADAQAAAGSASDASGYATAAGNAKTAAETAQGYAEAAKRDAEAASQAIQDMSVDATTLTPGSAATATKEVDPDTGAVTIHYGIPAGADATLDAGEATDIDGIFAGDGSVLSSVPFVTALSRNEKAAYLFRKSGGGGTVENRERLNRIIGGTVAWNQLLNNKTIAAGTYTWTSALSNVRLIEGHKYLLATDKEQLTLRFRNTIAGIVGNTGKELIYNATVSRNDYAIQADGTSTNVSKLWMTDLTQMFGSAIADRAYAMEQNEAGSGIAWLRSYGFLTAPYYAYNVGSLESVNAASHDMVGFNAWDEKWENGALDYTTGQDASGPNQLRSVDFVRVIGGEEYYFCTPTSPLRVYCFDENKTLIPGVGGSTNFMLLQGQTFTMPASCAYVRFCTSQNYVTYKRDICINRSKTTGTPKNGDYVGYKKNSYALDASLELRGLPKLDAENALTYDGDEYAEDGTVARKYGIVDLGTLSWGYDSVVFFSPSLSGAKKASGITATCAEYLAVANVAGATAAQNNPNMSVALMSNAGGADRVYLINTSKTGSDLVGGVASWLSGVYLVYELAAPTTETADSYVNPQVVDADGTEAFTDAKVAAGTRDVAIPVYADADYLAAENAVAELGGSKAVVPASLPLPLPEPPTADGTYALRAVIVDGALRYEWAAVS